MYQVISKTRGHKAVKSFNQLIESDEVCCETNEIAGAKSEVDARNYLCQDLLCAIPYKSHKDRAVAS